MPCYTLTNVLGLFKETYKQSVVCAVIALLFSVGAGYIYWPFVLIGPVFYYSSSLVYRMIIAKRRVTWFSPRDFFRRTLMLLVVIGGSCILSARIYGQGYPASWFLWVLHACVFGFCVLALSFIYVLLFERETFQLLCSYVKNIWKKRGVKNEL